MSKLYLITGFLGAGKTTFLKNFIKLFAGQKIQLIINEFGKEGVDGTLLANLGAYLEEISGGSVFCSCRLDQFEKVLIQSKDVNADVILVEASGLSDPTGVRKLFSQTERFPHIEYMGGVCLVDAVRFPKLYATARTCKKQLAASDIAVVNKIDRTKDTQLEDTVALIKGQRPDMKMIQTSFGEISKDILDDLNGIQRSDDAENYMHTADLTIKKLLVTINPTMSRYELAKFIEMFIEDTYRIKGFIQTTDGLMLVDCVSNVAYVEPYAFEVDKDKIGNLVVLSGDGMPTRKSVKLAVSWYEKHIVEIS